MWAEWHDSGWEHMMGIVETEIVQLCVNLLYEEVELIIEDKWVTFGICILFCKTLLMSAARLGLW